MENIDTVSRTRSLTKCGDALPVTSLIFDSYKQDFQQQPLSPASSSTSQTTGDTTFEPSVDMMVDDFDDEQTLREEETLAELEVQDPANEIATLQKESEMPLEDLLAQYNYQLKKQYTQKRSKKFKLCRKSLKKKQLDGTTPTDVTPSTDIGQSSKTPNTLERSDDELELPNDDKLNGNGHGMAKKRLISSKNDYQNLDLFRSTEETEIDEQLTDEEKSIEHPGKISELSKRSHLLALYPEEFGNVDQKLDDASEDDEDGGDMDFMKRTIMVGTPYQAVIPLGLSKYGDVLPYENEDKLVWEPSQVSEREVEEYLIRVKEHKYSSDQDQEVTTSSTMISDHVPSNNVVKDDEQVLHLLVQCGYNFKEALRRKSLNAVPLTGSISLWSEDECKNFEEGIQKYGKDFRKIQQLQVRTRSIRELVQFYYLWKKTDRRDQDIVDSDTVDHMDIYLDSDERDSGSNNVGKIIPLSSSDNCLTHEAYAANTPYLKSQTSNFSIMNEAKRLGMQKEDKAVDNTFENQADRHQTVYRRRNSLLTASKNQHHVGNKNQHIVNECTLNKRKNVLPKSIKDTAI